MIELKYDPVLMPAIDESLGSDFWQYGPVGKSLIDLVKGPIKFSESVSIFIERGKCRFNLSLQPYEVSGAATVFIRRGDILQIEETSDDVQAYCMLFSPAIAERLFEISNGYKVEPKVLRCPVNLIPGHIVPQFLNFYTRMQEVASDASNPCRLDAIVFFTASFLFQIAYLMRPLNDEERIDIPTRTVEVFLRLAQKNFRQHRFLPFYAEKMKITPKHLSRTIKQRTGLTATDWLDRFVVLEAKVLLKSSNLNIQEISDNLNFPSQSFFCKYFKRTTGLSPSEYRNKK